MTKAEKPAKMQDNLGHSTDLFTVITSSKMKTSCLAWIPCRFIFTFMCLTGMCMAFGLRGNLNLAIVAMVNSTQQVDRISNSTQSYHEESCPYEVVNLASSSISLSQQGKFLWSPTSQGNILGAFYYGYTSTQIFGGRMGELVSAKWLYFAGLFGSSVFSLLTPICAEWGEAAMVVVRVFNGLFQGIIFPSLFVMVAKWIPTKERNTVLAICHSGPSIGTIIAMPLTGYLCEYGFDGGWPSAFYVYGIAGCVYCFLYVFIVFDSPSVHPRISDNELTYICGNPDVEEKKEMSKQKSRPIPWKALLLSKPVWAMNLARFAGAYDFHIVLTRIPAYLDSILHQSITENSLYNSLFHVITVVCMITSGLLADFILRKKYLSNTVTRKVFETLSQLGAAACIVSVPLVGCNSTVVIVLVAVAMGCVGVATGGTLSLAPEIAPAFTGTVFGISNTFASSTGFIAPLVVGALLETNNGGMKQWALVFYITAAINVFAAIVFLVFGSGEAQEWAKEEEVKPQTTDEKQRF